MEQFERRQKIAELVNSKGKVKVTELSELFGISEVSVRSDLADLEAKGLLSRIHGGAVSSYKTYYNMDMQQRLSANRDNKDKMYEDKDGYWHCIYVVSDDFDYGILIESEGSDYPRYTAYLPKAIFDLK